MAKITEVDFDGGTLTYTCTGCDVAGITVPLEDLVLGDPDGPSPDLVRLPQHEACGGWGFFLRTWDAKPEADSPRRRAVNAVAQHLLETGQSAPNHAKGHSAEKKSGRAPAFVEKTSGVIADIRGDKRAQRQAEEANAVAAAVATAHAVFVEAALKSDTEWKALVLRTAKDAVPEKERKGWEPTPAELSAAEKRLRDDSNVAKPPTKLDYLDAIAGAKRAAVVRVRANRKAGRPIDAEVPADELVAADAELTEELNAATVRAG